MKTPLLPFLWLKEFRALSKDRLGLAALFLMPAVFILVMSLALRETLRTNGGVRLTYAVVDLDGTQTSRDLAEALQGDGFAPEPGLTAAGPARAAVRKGRVPFAVLIEPGFEERVRDGATPMVTLVLDPAVAAPARAAFRQRLQGTLGALQARILMRGMAVLLGGAKAPAVDPEALRRSVREEAGSAVAPPSAVQQNVPAWLIFGMFFVVVPISSIFVTERQQGTLQRLRSMGLGHGALLAGKLAPFMAVNVLQALLMAAVGRWVVPLLGGEALILSRAVLAPLLIMSLAVSMAAVSWALLVASAARTLDQATIVGGVGNILMGAVGGIMVPRFVMPAEMRPWTALSPMSWGLDGFHAVMLRGEGLRGILFPGGCLVLFGLAALALASYLIRKGTQA